ncbi:MAG: GYD domain-containing protein [Anaerolineales bacterium]|nr:GYD domain-containing protein [Anaerolineales bacterium]
MQKYLFYGSYTPEGYRGLLEEGGSVRIEVSKRALQSVGGSLEAFYYSNGEQDFYIIVNLPDNVSSTAITLAGNASGTFCIRAVALLTPEEMDEAVKMKVDFRPPGHS